MPLRDTTAAILLAASMLCCGCGDEHAGVVPVSGTVTIDGAPLTLGQVKLLADGHRAAMGKIEQDGSFQLSCFELGDGAPVGTHVVTVTALEQLSETSSRWHAPKKYANKVATDIRVTIDGPTDNLEIKLTWEGDGQSGPFVEKH